MSENAYQEFLPKRTIVRNFAALWDEYCEKYNLLMENMEQKGINCGLLKDVLNLRDELLREKIALQVDSLIKI